MAAGIRVSVSNALVATLEHLQITADMLGLYFQGRRDVKGIFGADLESMHAADSLGNCLDEVCNRDLHRTTHGTFSSFLLRPLLSVVIVAHRPQRQFLLLRDFNTS
jgi:hypothetical protein